MWFFGHAVFVCSLYFLKIWVQDECKWLIDVHMKCGATVMPFGGGGLDLMTQLSVIKKLKSKEKWRLVTCATLKVILDFNKEKRYDEDVCLHFKITVESKK